MCGRMCLLKRRTWTSFPAVAASADAACLVPCVRQGVWMCVCVKSGRLDAGADDDGSVGEEREKTRTWERTGEAHDEEEIHF